jgi:Flp pilus assembly protein TadD
MAAGLLALSTLAVYFPALSAGFINLDDPLYVTANRHVLAGLTRDGVVWAFANGEAGLWIPLAWLSHMLDCQLFGVHPFGHHLTSLVLHIVNTVLLFFALRLMTGATWPPVMVATLFALHPLRVESVVWVAERKDVLSVLFALLALHAYVRYSRRRGAARYVLVMLCFALGLMAKPMLVTLPGVLLLLDYWPLDRSRPAELVVEKLPFLLLAAPTVAATLIAARSDALMTLGSFPPHARLANGAVSYARYLGKAVWPTDLAVFYPLEPWWPWHEVLGAALLLVAITVVTLLVRRTRPYLLVGWLWFVGTLVPVIGLVQAGSQAMADRFTYFPLIGLFIAVTWAATDACERFGVRRPAVAGIACVVGLLLAACTRHNLAYWKDSEALFSHALAVTHNNYLAHDNLGDILLKRGDVQAATAHFEEAVRLLPGYAHGEYNLGVAMVMQGRLDDAEGHFLRAIRLQPGYADAEFNLGNALARRGRNSEALFYLGNAVQHDPYSAPARAGFGTALLNERRIDEAVEQLSQAVSLKADLAEAHYNLGLALTLQGKSTQAADHYARAFAINPALRAGAQRQ